MKQFGAHSSYPVKEGFLMLLAWNVFIVKNKWIYWELKLN